MPETTMKVSKDTVTISELMQLIGEYRPQGQTVPLKHADPREFQHFIDPMLALIKGKSVNVISKTLFKHAYTRPETCRFYVISLLFFNFIFCGHRIYAWAKLSLQFVKGFSIDPCSFVPTLTFLRVFL